VPIPEQARTLLEKHLRRYRDRLIMSESRPGFRPDELRYLLALWESMDRKNFTDLTYEEYEELFEAILDEE